MMKTVLTDTPAALKNPVLFYNMGSDKKIDVLSTIPKEYESFLTSFLKLKYQSAEKKNDPLFLSVYHPVMGMVLLVPASVLKEPYSAQKSGGKIAVALRKEKITVTDIIFPDTPTPEKNHIYFLWMGIAKANYAVTKKSAVKAASDGIKTLRLSGRTDSLTAAAIKNGEIVAGAIHMARDIQNTPGNLFTPADFKRVGKKTAQMFGLGFESYNTEQIKKMGMGCFYAVAKGSDEDAYLNVLKYEHKKSSKTILLVGKGLTFDSGGYSLKPPKSMEDMKFDKCGGAVVLSVMHAIAQLKPKINIIGLIPASENLINGRAMKPGDIYEACNGKTVEVLNTDAEGRLILCDSIAFGIKKYAPSLVIDIATLTGACIVALGNYNAGLFSNDDALSAQLTHSGNVVGEPVWRMPMNQEYRKSLESTYADLKNIGGGSAGAITAAWFLREFVGDVPWAHLDIAGVMQNIKHPEYYPQKGASGFGVDLLIHFILTQTIA